MSATAMFDTFAETVTASVEERWGYEGGDVWREDPVTFAEFVTSREHLGLGPLFPLQQGAMDELLGQDPKLIFEEPREGEEWLGRVYQLAVLLWGKGSGKDYLCSCVVPYLVHVLLCLRDPQAFFSFGRGEAIDVINVAYSADQAKKVFFEKLKQRLYGWAWLSARFNVYESGRRRGDHIIGRPEVHINDGEVVFPRGIRCFSRHSENESYEGFNVIAWVMDEASAFLSKLKRENADRIYQTLRTSAASRFQRRWVGFIISYPRHGDDFTMTKLREAQANPELGMLGDGPRTTWEVNENLGREQFVEVRDGHVVPVELANDYLLDFEEALARYECQPPAARDAFFRFPDRLDAALAKGRRPLVEWEPDITRMTVPSPDGTGQITRVYRSVKLTRLGKLPKGTKVYFHGDPGLVKDSFALALGHGVPATILLRLPACEVMPPEMLDRHCAAGHDPYDLVEWEREVTRTVIDAVIVWEPDPRQDMQVDLQNVEDTILELRKHYRLGHPGPKPTGTFDHWNSAQAIQRMTAKKMNVEDEQWSRGFQVDVYRNARSNFYNDLVTLPDTPSVTSTDPLSPGALHELKRIEFIDGQKVDHPEGGSKDIADAVVRVIQHVTGAARSAFSFAHAHGSGVKYGHIAPMIPTETPRVNPASPPRMANPAAVEAEALTRAALPLGELSPAEGTVNGRRFGTVRRA